ncbi:MAG: hypothetical protein K5745_00930 [Saccharofermentans sp.]|nr:hypothetical protein [Saccharofermentans sp.]
MQTKRIMCMVLAAALLLTGCNKTQATQAAETTTEQTTTTTIQTEQTTTTAPQQQFEYDLYPYVELFAEDIPQEYWDAFYNLTDALRAGETTFECGSREAYDWAIDWNTLNQLIPAASLVVTEDSYANGVGSINYEISPDEFVVMQSEFETLVEDILNSTIEYDDTDFEKAIKLWGYMVNNFCYEDYDVSGDGNDGQVYYCFVNKAGLCAQLAGVYTFLLQQAGVEAVTVGCYDPEISHEWVYMLLDGRAYHSDPTWGLNTYTGTTDVGLYYFLMTDGRRGEECPVTDLSSPLLPGYWESSSNVEFEATDDTLMFPAMTWLVDLDESSKVITYLDNDERCELSYG